MNIPHCEYCGCTEIHCLAKCPVTGLHFCNGKGLIAQSHIIHFLRSTRSVKFTLPPENPFSQSQLTCVICGSENIYQLGFLYTMDKTCVFIVCRSPCQYNEGLSKYQIDREHFIPFISNGEVTKFLIAVPNETQYHKIPPSRAIAVVEATKSFFSLPETNNFIKNLPSQNSDGSEIRKGPLPPAKVSYSSVDDYCSSISAFIRSEQAALREICDYQMVNALKVKVTWISDNQCSFKSPPVLYKATSLGGTIIVNNVEKSKITSRKTNFTMNITFRSRPSFCGQSSISVAPETNLDSFEKQLKAIDLFRTKFKNEFLLNIFLGKLENFARNNNCQPIPLCQSRESGLPPLNESQRSCVEIALKQRFSMIQGPPGTGKTTVIAALAFSFVRAGIGPVLVCAQSNCAVDLATRRISRTGVNVIRVLSRTREDVSTDVLEFSSRKIASEKHFDFEDLFNSTDKKKHRMAVDYERNEIKHCQVVCATCGSAISSRFAKMKFPVVIFDESGQCTDADLLCAIVHASDRVVLVGDHRQLGPIVMSREGSKARYDMSLLERLVVAGLRPSVLTIQYRMHPAISSFPAEAFYGKMLRDGVSELDRKWAYGLKKKNNQKKSLTQQNTFENDYSDDMDYSDDQPLVEHNFPSLDALNLNYQPNFYNNNLSHTMNNNNNNNNNNWWNQPQRPQMTSKPIRQMNHVQTQHAPKFNLDQLWPNKRYPMFFWNVYGEEEYADDGISFVNQIEGEKIAQLILFLVSCGVELHDIGIITPYAGQQIFLIETLPALCKSIPQEDFEDLEIASVDAFQGREKDFIIFSCVRVNPKHEIGFLRDTRRLCVSLTRAKYGLMVIGNAETFSEEDVWKRFIIHCQNLGVLTQGKDLKTMKPTKIIDQDAESTDPLVNTETMPEEIFF